MGTKARAFCYKMCRNDNKRFGKPPYLYCPFSHFLLVDNKPPICMFPRSWLHQIMRMNCRHLEMPLCLNGSCQLQMIDEPPFVSKYNFSETAFCLTSRSHPVTIYTKRAGNLLLVICSSTFACYPLN